MRTLIVTSLAVSLLSLGINVAAEPIDRAIVHWTSEVASFSESGPELSMQVAVNSRGIPIELKFVVKNKLDFPVQLYFPRDKDAFAEGIYIVGADGYGYKPRVVSGQKPLSETFEYYGLAPREELNWEYKIEDLVLDFDEYINMVGYLRVSFGSLLYLDKENSGSEDFLEFDRLRARVTWSANI